MKEYNIEYKQINEPFDHKFIQKLGNTYGNSVFAIIVDYEHEETVGFEDFKIKTQIVHEEKKYFLSVNKTGNETYVGLIGDHWHYEYKNFTVIGIAKINI